MSCVKANDPNPNKITKPNLSADKGINESAFAIGGVKYVATVINILSAIANQIQGFKVTSFLKNDKWRLGILKTLCNCAKMRVKKAMLFILFGGQSQYKMRIGCTTKNT